MLFKKIMQFLKQKNKEALSAIPRYLIFSVIATRIERASDPQLAQV